MTQEEKLEQQLIKKLRVMSGISQEALAAMLYYSKPAVGHWEKGKLRAPWEALYKVLPELKTMREQGCQSVCKQPRACLGGMPCPYLTGRSNTCDVQERR